MWYKDHIGCRTKRFLLHIGRLDKNGRGNADAWNAAVFEVCQVMYTTRRARTSVRKTFYHKINLASYFLF